MLFRHIKIYIYFYPKQNLLDDRCAITKSFDIYFIELIITQKMFEIHLNFVQLFEVRNGPKMLINFRSDSGVRYERAEEADTMNNKDIIGLFFTCTPDYTHMKGHHLIKCLPEVGDYINSPSQMVNHFD